MIRRHLHWIVAVVLIVSVAGACLVRTRPAPRGRPVYVVPAERHEKHRDRDDHDNGRGHGHEKHKKHKKHD
jgi:hypothetical protein